MARALFGQTTLIAFALLVLIGGSNAVAVRISYAELPPFWGAALRFAAAALIFWVIVLGRRITLPRGRALVGALVYGLLTVGASYAFLYWALLRVQAALAMVVLAFVPLMTLFFAWAHGLETLSWRRLLGALIAIAGILIVVIGGLAVSAAEMAFAGGLGAKLNLAGVPLEPGLIRPDHILFSESQSRYLVEVRPENYSALLSSILPCHVGQVGVVTDQSALTIVDSQKNTLIEEPIEALKESWQRTFSW